MVLSHTNPHHKYRLVLLIYQKIPSLLGNVLAAQSRNAAQFHLHPSDPPRQECGFAVFENRVE